MLSQLEKFLGLVVWTKLTDTTPTQPCHVHLYTGHGEKRIFHFWYSPTVPYILIFREVLHDIDVISVIKSLFERPLRTKSGDKVLW